MSFEFSYTLDLLTDVLQFFSRNEPLKLGKGIPNSATTVVLDSKGGVWKRFEPRKYIRLSVPELLWLAEVDGGQDRLHAMILKSFEELVGQNSSLDGIDVTTESTALPNWIYFTGA